MGRRRKQSTGTQVLLPGWKESRQWSREPCLVCSLSASLGCVGAWRSIYRGGQSMRKYLIHCQRTHRETQETLSTAQLNSSTSEQHVLQGQPRHLRCSSSVILPEGQMLPQEVLCAASLTPHTGFHVFNALVLIVLWVPALKLGSALGAAECYF